MKAPCKPQKLGPLEDLTGTSLGCQVQAGYTANPVQHEKFFSYWMHLGDSRDKYFETDVYLKVSNNKPQ